MHILFSRAVRGAACVAIALSAVVAVQAKTPVKPVDVPVRHMKAVSTQSLAAKRAQPMPAPARPGVRAMPQRVETLDSDGSRFQYDSCGCSGA